MLDFVREHSVLRDSFILQGHPLRHQHILYFGDGVSVFDVLIDSFRGPWRSFPYSAKIFPGAVRTNRISSSNASFFAETKFLVKHGCIVKRSDVRSPSRPVQPLLIQALSVEETKPRSIYDTRPLNQRGKRVRFTMMHDGHGCARIYGSHCPPHGGRLAGKSIYVQGGCPTISRCTRIW